MSAPQPPIGQMMAGLIDDLAPLMAFVDWPAYRAKIGSPGIADFVFGNPHEMPLPGLTAAIVRHAQPQDEDWFAYKMNEDPGRAAIAASLEQVLPTPVDPEDIFLTPGTFGGLSICLRTICSPGDEVIFLSPPWFFYESMIKLVGATSVRVTLNEPFHLDLDAIASAITPNTRAILVNTPNNPTGVMYTADELRGLADLLRERTRADGSPIVLLSDESYRRITFDEKVHVSPALFYEHTLILYTYGKTLLAPGERLGYIALPAEMPNRPAIREAMFLSQVVGGWQFPNATLQRAVADLEKLSIDITALQARRDRLVGGLRSFGYEVLNPEGTFYIMVRSPIPDSRAFTDALAARDVFVGPGYVFEMPDWFRLSMTANDEMVEMALPVFADLLKTID